MVIVHSTGRRSAAHLLADHEKPVALYLLESNLRRVLPFDRAPRDALRLFREGPLCKLLRAGHLGHRPTTMRRPAGRSAGPEDRRVAGRRDAVRRVDRTTPRSSPLRRSSPPGPSISLIPRSLPWRIGSRRC